MNKLEHMIKTLIWFYKWTVPNSPEGINNLVVNIILIDDSEIYRFEI